MIVPAFGFDLGIKSANVTAQMRQNLYMDVKTEKDKTSIVLYGTPGLTLFNGAAAGANPYRGVSEQIGNLFYGVKNGTFLEINNSGVETSRGTINSTGGNVSLSYNGQQVLIVDGTNGYIYSPTYLTLFQVKSYATGNTTSTSAGKLVDSGATFTTAGVKAGMIALNTTDGTQSVISNVDSQTQLSVVTDTFPTGKAYTIGSANFPNGATNGAFQGGFFLVDDPANNGRFWKSASYDGTNWSALDFATAESSPDALTRVFVNQGIVHLLGDSTTEFWSNVGALNFPYALIQGSPIEWGIAARWSVAKLMGAVTFVAKNLQGHVQIVTLNGFQPQPISSPELEAELDTYTVSDAVGFSYMLNGHQFYQVSFPTNAKTWLYDATMSQVSGAPIWSRLVSGSGRHLAQFYINFLNQNLATDYSSGNIYKMLASTYTDNGATIRRVLRSKHIFRNNQQVAVGRLWVDFETGVGLTTGQGSNPQVMMRYSKDGGHTWSTELWATLGAIGKYLTRAIWQRLGRARDWVFELCITDPVKVVILNAGLRIVEGRE